jgi:hypothetical protein
VEERSEELVDTGLEYLPGEAVLVRVIRRGRRVAVSDEGRAVDLSGRPPGWRDAVERLVEDEFWLNLSRQGAVHVPVVPAGPGLEALLERVAEASRAVYQEILDLEAL